MSKLYNFIVFLSISLILMSGCSSVGDSRLVDSLPEGTSAEEVIERAPEAVGVVDEPSPLPPPLLLLPEPWRFLDGSNPGNVEIIPYEATTEKGALQIGLIRAVSPNHVSELQKLFGQGAFKGAVLYPALSNNALVMKVDERFKLKKRLPIEAKPVAATVGSLYFDGDSRLMFLLAKTEVVDGWNFVGQVILEQRLVSAALSEKPSDRPIIGRVQGLSI